MSAELRLLLRDLRQAQDLSQDELARQLGISRQSIISLEQGAYLPSFPLLINMIHFFNCSLDQLVEGAPKTIQEVANKYFDDKYVIITVVPKESKETVKEDSEPEETEEVE